MLAYVTWDLVAVSVALVLVAAAAAVYALRSGRVGRLGAAVVILASALVVAMVNGTVFGYDCSNTDCGGRDVVAGYTVFASAAGLLGCGVYAVARRLRCTR